jgi:hypothetical protein
VKLSERVAGKPDYHELRAANLNRSKTPVFVLGAPRSGTTLLYHMLLSTGNFAIYRAESNVFSVLAPRFGGMRSERDRRELLAHWLKSKLFRVSGLDQKEITDKVLSECRSAGDFLRILMELVARKQRVERWADCTPDHLLHILEIKHAIPNALIIHIIRDGRDVALSYVRQGWAHPLPWDRSDRVSVAGLYWEWIVRRGRKYGHDLGDDYCEVHFEDLIMQPRATLSRLSEFIAQDLDYDLIHATAVGSVREPNSSFGEESGEFNPVERWKEKMSSTEAAEFDALLGNLLQELSYPLASGTARLNSIKSLRLRSTYLPLFGAKQWLKTHTPLGRRVHLGRIGMDR